MAAYNTKAFSDKIKKNIVNITTKTKILSPQPNKIKRTLFFFGKFAFSQIIYCGYGASITVID
jgi:hypothetical protein